MSDALGLNPFMNSSANLPPMFSNHIEYRFNLRTGVSVNTLINAMPSSFYGIGRVEYLQTTLTTTSDIKQAYYGLIPTTTGDVTSFGSSKPVSAICVNIPSTKIITIDHCFGPVMDVFRANYSGDYLRFYCKDFSGSDASMSVIKNAGSYPYISLGFSQTGLSSTSLTGSASAILHIWY